MNKVMLIVLLVCVLGCTMWLVAVNDKSNTYKKASVKSTPTETKSIIKPDTKSTIKTKINPKDGAEMILIPAGNFLMGTSDKELAVLQEKYPDCSPDNFVNQSPQHKVYLDAYYIYKTEVTVAKYRRFCKATKRKMPDKPDDLWQWHDNHPIVELSWYDANAYAKWAGVALPTEAQWEKAARGVDGRIYPWGNDWDETKCANFSNSGKGNTTRGTHPVGSFPTDASPYGVLDMSGNVDEWCADWYGTHYYKSSPVKNPTGPKTGEARVSRGGSWRDGEYDYYFANSISFRNYNFPRAYDYCFYGLRCVSPGQ